MLLAARNLARARSISLGAALSELARRGLKCARIATDEDGLPVFTVSPDARPVTLEDVKKVEDEL